MTAVDRETAAVLTTLATNALAQRDIVKTLNVKAPTATALIAMHQREQRLFELLHAEVATGLLERLEAGRL